MLSILLVTVRTDAVHEFAGGLSSDPGTILERAASGSEALGLVRARCPDLVIVDYALPDTGPLDLVRKIISINAMANTAVISPLADEEFHEASEGLGVLARLPLAPNRRDSEILLQKLRRVLPVEGV